MLYILPTIEVDKSKENIDVNNAKQLVNPYGNTDFKRIDFNVYYKIYVHSDEKCGKSHIYSFKLLPNQKIFKSLPLKKDIYMNYNLRTKLKTEKVGKFTYSNPEIEEMINSSQPSVKELGFLLLKKDIINSKDI